MNMGKKHEITLQDIAFRLNIASSTVSRALNNHPKISHFTKEAVLKMAIELNYLPNSIASALRNGKSGFLAIVIPAVDKLFFASIINGVEELAKKYSYKVVVCQSGENPEAEVHSIEMLLSAQVDGIIAFIGQNTTKINHFSRITDSGIPLVLIDRVNEELEVSQVVIDDYLGAYQLVSHLIQQGCRRIAHLTCLQRTSEFQERLRGYKDALRAYGIPYREELVIESNLLVADGRRSMEQLLKQAQVPDGVFSSGDYAAVGALQVLKERKVKIPEEVALAGFGNDWFTEYTDPPLTTVDQRRKTIGTIAAELLFKEVNYNGQGQYTVCKRIVKPTVLIRASSLKRN